MNKFTVVTLNVCYNPSIDRNSPYHFDQRWPYIQEALSGADVIALQEVHTEFLESILAFAKSHDYVAIACLYHIKRQMNLVTLVRGGQYISSATHAAPNTYSRMLSVMIMPAANVYYTIFNVHFSLDIANSGERLSTTTVFSRVAMNTNNAILIGDWNTLPGRGDEQQLAIARSQGTLVEWTFPDGGPRSTFWGYPTETSHELHEFNTPTILDHLLLGKNVGLIDAKCKHIFIKPLGARMMLSDHALCSADIRITE